MMTDIKTKIRTYGDKVYTNFRCLKLPKDDIESEFFTVSFVHSLLLYSKKYHLQAYLGNCAYKTVNKQMTDYPDEIFLKIRYYKCFVMIEMI